VQQHHVESQSHVTAGHHLKKREQISIGRGLGNGANSSAIFSFWMMWKSGLTAPGHIHQKEKGKSRKCKQNFHPCHFFDSLITLGPIDNSQPTHYTYIYRLHIELLLFTATILPIMFPKAQTACSHTFWCGEYKSFIKKGTAPIGKNGLILWTITNFHYLHLSKPIIMVKWE
jgi:hypothetical protein